MDPILKSKAGVTFVSGPDVLSSYALVAHLISSGKRSRTSSVKEETDYYNEIVSFMISARKSTLTFETKRLDVDGEPQVGDTIVHADSGDNWCITQIDEDLPNDSIVRGTVTLIRGDAYNVG